MTVSEQTAGFALLHAWPQGGLTTPLDVFSDETLWSPGDTTADHHGCRHGPGARCPRSITAYRDADRAFDDLDRGEVAVAVVGFDAAPHGRHRWAADRARIVAIARPDTDPDVPLSRYATEAARRYGVPLVARRELEQHAFAAGAPAVAPGRATRLATWARARASDDESRERLLLTAQVGLSGVAIVTHWAALVLAVVAVGLLRLGLAARAGLRRELAWVAFTVALLVALPLQSIGRADWERDRASRAVELADDLAAEQADRIARGDAPQRSVRDLVAGGELAARVDEFDGSVTVDASERHADVLITVSVDGDDPVTRRVAWPQPARQQPGPAHAAGLERRSG